MHNVLLAAIVALLGGVAVGIQNPIASALGQRSNLLSGAFAVHRGGTVVAGVLLALTRSLRWGDQGFTAAAVLAGGLGVGLISAISYSIPRIGVAAAVSLLFAAQVTVGAVFDHFGLLGGPIREMEPARIGGVALLLTGAWLVLR